MKKPPLFITNITFLTIKRRLFKKMKNYTFWRLILRNVKRKNFEFSKFVKYGQRYFDSERLWYSKLSFLKLRTVELAISFQQFLQSSRSQIFVKKDEIMRTFDICYENRWLFHRSLLKAVRNCRIKQMKN